MAGNLTRIKNNQVTDASTGNVVVGINAGTKLQNYSITSTKIANNLVYGSDLTISGNLTVNGTTTNVDTVNTLIQDPLITLADGQTTGTPTVDIGTIGLRGSQNSAVLGWKEDQKEFVTALSTTTVSNTTFTISSYANLHTGNATVQGTTSLVGNLIGAVNATDTITGGNLATPGTASAGGNITGGNLLTGGIVSATSNVIGGNITTVGQVSADANITGGNLNTAGQVSATGNGTFGNISTAGTFTSASLSVTGNITGGNVISQALVQGVTVSASGNLVGGNANITNAVNSSTVSASGNITGGNLLTSGSGGAISGSGNITGGNILTGGVVSATANVTGGNITTSGTVQTPDITNATAITITTSAGNLNLSPAGNIVLDNTIINGVAQPLQDQDAATKLYVDTVATTGITIHEAVYATTNTTLATATGGTISYTQPNGVSNGIGAYIQTTGSFTTIDTANVQTVGTRILVKNEANAAYNGVYTYSNSTAIVRSTDTDQYGASSTEELSINDYFFTTAGNVNSGAAFTVSAPAGTITFGTSNITFAQFSSSQTYTANTAAGLVLNNQQFNAKVDQITTAFDGTGNIIVKASAQLTTPNIGAATGSSLSVTGAVTAASTVGGIISGSSVSVTGTATAASTVGGVITGSSASLSGNVTGANVLTGGLISATGNIDGGNLLTTGLISASSTITSGANITGANILTGGLVSASSTITSGANITGANILTGGLVSATSNVTGGNILTGGIVSATANITGGNIYTAGQLQGGNIVISGDDITDTNGRVNFNTAGADVDFAVNGDTVANVFYVDAGTGTASFGSATQTINAIVAFNSSTSILAPVGNTAQRPGTGVTGMMRFNSTNNNLEIYDNTQWTAVGVPVFTVVDDQQFNGDGSTVAFTLNTSQTTNSCIVSINGIVQIPVSAYAVSGTTLTFTEAPAAGDLIDVREITTTTTVTSIANSSGNAVIAVSDTSATIVMTGDLQVTGNVAVLGTVATDTILNGTTQVQIPDANQDVHFDINGVNEVFLVGQFDSRFMGNVNPQANVTYNLGNTTNRWNDLWLASSTIYMGNARISANATSLIFTNPSGGQTVLAGASASSSVAGNVTGGNLLTSGLVSATSTITSGANITGANLLTGGLISATSTITSGANITGANILTAGIMSSTGNATHGNLTVGTGTITGGNIVNSNANGIGNIGSATTYFNTVFAKATSAQYADLAEKYTADAAYVPGTVVVFGGSAEVTVNAVDGDRKVAGVVSTNPSYIMNGGLEAEHVATVALTGRVPCLVVGPVKKGDLMVAAGLGRARADADPKVGSVIGKALEDFDGAEGTIEVVVGRF